MEKFVKQFTHFENLGGGWFHLWTMELCEGCECNCIGPNPQKIHNASLWASQLVALGLKAGKISAVPTLDWSDDFGGAVCHECDLEAGA